MGVTLIDEIMRDEVNFNSDNTKAWIEGDGINSPEADMMVKAGYIEKYDTFTDKFWLTQKGIVKATTN